MMKPLAVMGLVALSAAEVLTGSYRAVTLEVGQRRQFRAPGLETVTGSSGRCVEEGMDQEEPETMWIEGSCAGLRTLLAWKKGGARMHVMACVEDPETRPPDALKLRQKLQGELKALKSVTPCVRNGRVELWGWAETDAQLAQVQALEKKHGLDRVRSFVERLPAEE